MGNPAELRELYQELILDHGKNPRNFRAQDDAQVRRAEGHNPVCGDRLTVFVHIDGDTVRDVSFEGAGCAISTASASMMTQALKGKPVADARRLFASFHGLVTGELDAPPTELGKLAVFAGVRDFPVRVKCATLAWHTMQDALEERKEAVTTE